MINRIIGWELNGLDIAAKFTNANILTSSAGCKKWQQA
jgi:hypothetical protein